MRNQSEPPPRSPAAPSHYQMPPPALQAIVDAPRAPALGLSPRRDLASMVDTPALPGIADVAQPELKLAGVRINPRTYSPSRVSFGTGLKLLDIATQKEMAVRGLPRRLRLADLAWAPDQRHIAFSHVAYARSGAASAVELWVVEVATRTARRLLAQPLSYPAGSGFGWLPDSSGLLVQLRPASAKAPVTSGIPSGPATQDSSGDATLRQLRTYQDLLKNEEDARLFEHYATSQLALVDLAGTLRHIGAPDMVAGVSVSPDGQYLLAQVLQRPFSYVVPAGAFARRIEVWDLQGQLLHLVADKPLEEGLPPGNDAVSLGVRKVGWRADAPATLVWAEAQDGGNPLLPVPIRDIVYLQAAPFDQPPQVLARLAARFERVLWGRGDLALLTEFWQKTRAVRTWRVQPDQPDAAPRLAFEFSYEDRYQLPGSPVTMPDEQGRRRLVVSADDSILLIGPGASDDGDRPYIDRYNLATQARERLFQSEAPYYEAVVAILSDDGLRLLTTRESPSERPNFYLRDLRQPRARQLTALTRFPHPTPQLKDVQKELIRYRRADGVELSATLMLPPGYDCARDGPLPLLMWAYPQEFKSASAAGQTSGSPYEFSAIGYMGPAPMLALGYAVLDDPSMPIVGAGEAEPNDTYLAQLVASAEAAVQEVVRRGVAERHRIGIGGHSYGAFMTANLLAHTRLFRAGIARSGAYNRTLTPFGFQSEDRQFWHAKEVYHSMSPFNNADRIKDALLLVHGADDGNAGTYPMQSERMFQAIKGLGGTARLVMLPKEGHSYRARESIMHMLHEACVWLDRYVRDALPD